MRKMNRKLHWILPGVALIALSLIFVLAQAPLNLYIDASAGDGGVGSQVDPYNELSDINWTTGGDNSVLDAVAASQNVVVYLKKGTERREQLTFGTPGTSGNPIIFNAYGTGGTYSKTPIRCGNNPIYTVGASSAFDDVIVFEPFVMVVGAEHWMYYSGGAGASLMTTGLAKSSDGGFTWTKFGKVLDVGGAGEWDDMQAQSHTVLVDGDTYKMWYGGQRDPEVTYDAKIGYATSADGETWTKDGSNPVFEGDAGEWDGDNVGYPSVIKENGTYYMWYSGHDGAWKGIGLATSTDGIDWTRSGNNPVVTNESGGYAYQCHVIAVGSEYWMLYNDNTSRKIYYARSTDKVTWTGHKLAIDLGGGGEWDDYRLQTPSWFTENRIYYTGMRNGQAYKIGLAFNASTSGTDAKIKGSDIQTTWIDIENEEFGPTVDDSIVTADLWMRNIIPADQLDHNGVQVRVKIRANSGQNAVITGCSVGERSGTSPDYSEAPTRLTFDTGNSGITITAGTSEWSDWVNYTWATASAHLIHANLDDVSGTVYLIHRASYLSGVYYALADGDQTLTQDVTSGGTSGNFYNIDQIEIRLLSTANVWQSTLTTEPNQVFFNGTKGTNISPSPITETWGENSTDDHTGVTEDCYIVASEADANKNSGSLSIKWHDAGGYNRRSALRFDLSAIPDGSTINSVALKICTSSDNGEQTLYCHKLLQTGWTENGVTWNKYDGSNAWGSAGADQDGVDVDGTVETTTGALASDTFLAAEGIGTWIEFSGADMVTAVSAALAGDSFEVLLTGNADASQLFHSREGTNTLRPYLEINWDRVTGDNLDEANEWVWGSNVIYVYSTSDPDINYFEPGIEVSQRDFCIDTNSQDYIIIQQLKLQHGNAANVLLDGANQTDLNYCISIDGIDGVEIDTAVSKVQNCIIYDCINGIDVDAAGDVKNTIIRNCTDDLEETGASINRTTNSIQDDGAADPLMTDPANDDFTLQFGSPCMNMGVHLGLFLDYAGLPVPIGHRPDIGAYEHKDGSNAVFH